MKFGLISDIHGNYSGLKKTVEQLQELECQIVCLGDLVSEDSDENESCIRLIKENKIHTVFGQHDDTCVKVNSPPVSGELSTFLQTIPNSITIENCYFVHDNPLQRARNGQGMWRQGSYIRSNLESSVVFSEFFPENSGIDYVIIGHTHCPKIFTPSGEIEIKFNKSIELPDNEPCIINPGCIGGVTRDCEDFFSYAIFNSARREICYHKIDGC